MRKDFLVEPVQVLEARKAGASGVLLITTMLDDAKLASMVDLAFEHRMFVLLESFDEEDLRRSARLLDREGQLLIGVAESGLHSAEDAARVADWGYRLALVGTALMRSDDPTALVRSMKAAGAAACS